MIEIQEGGCRNNSNQEVAVILILRTDDHGKSAKTRQTIIKSRKTREKHSIKIQNF